jgi:hypothetical protein
MLVIVVTGKVFSGNTRDDKGIIDKLTIIL